MCTTKSNTTNGFEETVYQSGFSFICNKNYKVTWKTLNSWREISCEMQLEAAITAGFLHSPPVWCYWCILKSLWTEDIVWEAPQCHQLQNTMRVCTGTHLGTCKSRVCWKCSDAVTQLLQVCYQSAQKQSWSVKTQITQRPLLAQC